MKKNRSILIAFFIIIFVSCNNRVDTEKEKDAIITVIENETNSYFAKNFEQQSNSFLQDESLIVLVSRKSGFGYAVGWNQISESIKQNIEKNPNPIAEKFENTDYKIKVYEKSAWAVYDENVYDSEGEFIRKVINVRVLEKIDNEWKIVYLSDVNTTSYETEDKPLK